MNLTKKLNREKYNEKPMSWSSPEMVWKIREISPTWWKGFMEKVSSESAVEERKSDA